MKTKNLMRIIAIFVVTILVASQLTTVAAFGRTYNTNTRNTTTNTTSTTTSTEVAEYEEFLKEIQEAIGDMNTSGMTVDEAKVEVFKIVEELQEKYEDVDITDYVTNQILNKVVSSESTSTNSFVTSISSTISSLMGDTDIALDSLEVDDVITITAESAAEFAGTDYGVTLSGNIYYADKTSNKWAVLVHGFMMNGQAIADAIGQMYLDQGFNVFAPDLRGWGNSEGDEAMGYLESLDVYDWLKYLNANYTCDEIIVHGISLGGATTLFLAGQEGLEDLNVVGLVDDCGYTSMVGIVKDLLENIGSNELVAEILGLINIDISQYADEETLKEYLLESVDTGLTEANFDEYSDAMNKFENCSVPILIIHGTEDAIVPYSNSDTVYNNAVANANIPYIQRFVAEDENHAFITLGTKASAYEGHLDNFIENAEKVANGGSVTRISDYEYEGSTSTSMISQLINGIKLIKNILGL